MQGILRTSTDGSELINGVPAEIILIIIILIYMLFILAILFLYPFCTRFILFPI